MIESPSTENILTTSLIDTNILVYANNEDSQFHFPTDHTIETLTGLIAKHKPRSQSVFDYLMVATMMDNAVYEIYTANSKHFKPFTFIKVINPLKD